MLKPTKVTIHIREATTTLITSMGPYWTGNPSGIITFEGENRTFAVTKAVVFLRGIACPSEKYEWALVCWGMCNWLLHKADPTDSFKSNFSYASGMFWKIDLSIEEIVPCQIQPELPLTNTKSLLRSLLNGWNWLCRNT